jgi:hypothetical protein
MDQQRNYGLNLSPAETLGYFFAVKEFSVRHIGIKLQTT